MLEKGKENKKMTRTPTTEELNEIKKSVLSLFGIGSKKKRTRGRSDTLPVYTLPDCTHYKHKKNALATGEKLKKAQLSCDFILEEYRTNGWLPPIHDMSEKEILDYCKKHR
jgi:hypothetical protein